MEWQTSSAWGKKVSKRRRRPWLIKQNRARWFLIHKGQTMDVIVYYLEMLAHAKRVARAPREGLAVVHAKKPTVAYYRFLYDAVGRDYD
jgi:hypothetical protein